jgi:hypothetical protein
MPKLAPTLMGYIGTPNFRGKDSPANMSTSQQKKYME